MFAANANLILVHVCECVCVIVILCEIRKHPVCVCLMCSIKCVDVKVQHMEEDLQPPSRGQT